MKYLTEKELAFYEALIKDYQIRGDKSFIKTMFLSSFNFNNKIELKLKKLFENSYSKFFIESDLLFSSIDSCIIGKYKNFYWATGSEGELYSVGREIQNLPYLLINNLGDINDIFLIKTYFKNILNIDYLKCLKEYKEFCTSFDLEYHEDLNYITQQCEEFNTLIKNLE